MSLDNIVKASPTNINTCDEHKTGNGRECVYLAESENYAVNTFESASTMTVGK